MPVPPLRTSSYACILPERRGAHKKQCRGRGLVKRRYERTDFGPAIYSTSTLWLLESEVPKMKEQLSLQRWVVSGGSIKAKSNARTDVLPIGRSLRRRAGDRGNKHEGHF